MVGRNPTIFHLLMSRFREMKGTVELYNVAKELKYTKYYTSLNKDKATVITEEFQNTKSRQEENLREMLDSIDDRDVLIFTDGLAFGNPGSTRPGAVVCLDGNQSVLVILKKSVSPLSNNYTGELVGIQIALEFLSGIYHSDLVDGCIHIFTDCQSKKESKDQEWIQSSTTPDTGYQWESDYHKFYKKPPESKLK